MWELHTQVYVLFVLATFSKFMVDVFDEVGIRRRLLTYFIQNNLQ